MFPNAPSVFAWPWFLSPALAGLDVDQNPVQIADCPRLARVGVGEEPSRFLVYQRHQPIAFYRQTGAGADILHLLSVYLCHYSPDYMAKAFSFKVSSKAFCLNRSLGNVSALTLIKFITRVKAADRQKNFQDFKISLIHLTPFLKPFIIAKDLRTLNLEIKNGINFRFNFALM